MYPSTITFLLGLSAVVSAAPATPYRQQLAATRSTNQGFSLSTLVNGTYVPLTATYNGTDDLVLQAGSSSASTGTPAYINSTDPSSSTAYSDALILDLTSSESTEFPAGVYGVSVPDLGELYGVSANVIAAKNYQEFEYSVNDETIYHQLTAATQDWFVCVDTVDGVQGDFLKWGVFKDTGGSPDGCSPTTVMQSF